MTRSISARVAELGLTLDAAAAPAANYVPFVLEGNLLYISGQISRKDGKAAYLGRLGDQVSDADGVAGIRMTLTAPGCPAAQSLPVEVARKVKAVEGVNDARVDVVWDPPWTKDRMSDAAELQLGLW